MDDNSDVLINAPELGNESCRLFGMLSSPPIPYLISPGPFALGVQALMGVIVLGALVFKRYREPYRRPWKIWLCDVSKQIIGQAFVHGFNLLVSDFFAVHGGENPCSGYFLNITIDTTIGVLIIYGFMKLFHWLLVTKLHNERFRSGHYGKPPSIISWLLQLVVYVLILTLMKLLVAVSLAILPLFSISDFLLDEISPNAQVIISMCIWPLIMNVLQFWLIDSLIKSKSPSEGPNFKAQSPHDDFDVGDDSDDDSDAEHHGFLRKEDIDEEEEEEAADNADISRSLEEGRRRDDSKDGDDGGNSYHQSSRAPQNSTNNGFSRANNSSTQESRGEYIPLNNLSLSASNLRYRLVTHSSRSQVVF
ncbi:hypothetical protein E3Q01_00834 [Wallemia mellicola]|uniref:Vacuolar membrane protein n=2 Tax=Wallemia mellicola TaxID=1708541 RepID=A0A4T0TT93_9BASI|nr:hypothetical protein E3Q14_00433 [Wallemia mellicola]TIC68437.1 hypothetical protein E3Q01_00834 [Wallemia mellicola]